MLQAADGGDAVTLELAEPADGETTTVCRRNGTELFRVPENIRTRLAKAPVLWRSPKVWPFSTLDVGKVEISAGADSIVVDKIYGLWTLADGGEADSVAFRRRLTALADLEVRDHDLLLPPTEVMGSVILVLDDDRGAEDPVLTLLNVGPHPPFGHVVAEGRGPGARDGRPRRRCC